MRKVYGIRAGDEDVGADVELALVTLVGRAAGQVTEHAGNCSWSHRQSVMARSLGAQLHTFWPNNAPSVPSCRSNKTGRGRYSYCQLGRAQHRAVRNV